MPEVLINPLSIDSGEVTIDSSITIDGGPLSIFTADQYAQAAKSLLPPGRAWNPDDGGVSSTSLTEVTADSSITIDSGGLRMASRFGAVLAPEPLLPVAGSNQSLFCNSLGLIYAKQDADSLQMLSDFFPATATQGIPEWNAALGLPDSCMGAPANLAANQQQIVARLISTGGQAIPYYAQIAAALGFVISITEFSPTEPGGDAPPGMIVNDSDWAHTWRVNILNSESAPSSSLLECLLERYKPAHTQFYIVIGTSPTTSTRLFEVVDDVSESLLIEITVR